ncbi:hypothetical protein SOVF_039580 [Spinacia oleracea]|uniref:Seipin-1 n=1 Tax=Spinacia oleracea TaxID=3562 RepID=A0A9R0IMP0_SPIOL|nr:seipin-1 [Spinacia oleracea]KNA21849.1 hypothetical protein SOVF_039580 [Spinacia oleracea]
MAEEKGGLGEIISITNWFPSLVETQVDLIATTFTSILTTFPTPSFSLSSSTIYKHPHSQAQTAETQAQKVVRKVGYGILGAVYAAMVLALVMAVAVILGVLLVNLWVEKPVVVREKLYFDYTDANPSAVFVFGGNRYGKHGGGGVPVGHTFHVSVVLVVPDSDYNRDIGVFQLMAEVVATNGKLIARSSQPSMLQFHSYPIRLMRTFIMSFPILLGISRETQTIKVQMLRYKEDNLLRTDAVKITLMPRAGTPYYLPQIYEAEILMHSKLPRVKELVYNWKWTFYVWTSLSIYVLLLVLLLNFFKTLLVSPFLQANGRERETEAVAGEVQRPVAKVREGREFSDTLRKWQQYRRKRKSALLSRSTFTDDSGGSTSASSYTIIKDDFEPPTTEEDVGDSESVCM